MKMEERKKRTKETEQRASQPQTADIRHTGGERIVAMVDEVGAVMLMVTEAIEDLE